MVFEPKVPKANSADSGASLAQVQSPPGASPASAMLNDDKVEGKAEICRE